MKKDDNHFSFEEEFHAKDRKQDRKERKHATTTDRSKYKKSDQDQLKKREHKPLSSQENLKKGRVLAITPEGIIVDAQDQLFICNLKGSLKKEKNRLKNLVAVGDFVHFVSSSEKEGSIIQIEERYSILSRADNLSRRKEQLIAVNIDQVLITTSVVSPPLKTQLIDRYIIAAEKGNMQPIIVVNKIDLLDSPPLGINLELIEQEKALFKEFLKTYQDLNIPIFVVSAETNRGMDLLKDAMRNKASVFSGQSGVGKSSLINGIAGTSLKTGKIVEKTHKGSHTTSTAYLLPLENGGFCIDTPGIRSFGVWDLSLQEIRSYFTEIHAASENCRYPDCTHLQEPGCAVQKLVENNQISNLRFSSYCALMESVKTQHKNR